MIDYSKSVFDQIEKTMILSGVLRKRGILSVSIREAMKEYKTYIRSSTKKGDVLRKNVLRDVKRKADRIRIGEMYSFAYPVPKYKSTLPYFDQMPVMICTKIDRNGFEGINLHYFPTELREALFENLMDQRTTGSFSEQSRFKMPIDVRSGYRTYLKRKVFSSIIHIRATDWFSALYLPVENFYGREANKVWLDTIKETRQ